MAKQNTKSKQGFTIIEVVLVLAIAGLIFLMVFIALPNLQRTQRDTQRRDDIDRLSSAMVQYVTNNKHTINPDHTVTPSGGGTPTTVTDDGPYFVTNDNAFSIPTASGTSPLFTAEATTKDADTPLKNFANGYLLADGNDKFEDPNGLPYIIYLMTFGSSQPDELAAGAFSTYNTGVAVIANNAACNTEGNVEDEPFVYINGTRRFAVAMRLEGNGVYCVDN